MVAKKIKLLKLMELLRQDTDEKHPMTKADICTSLGAMGVSCDKTTLGRDVKLLREQGYEIMESNEAEILRDNMVRFNTRKHTNEQIYYNVLFLEGALRLKRKASFCYCTKLLTQWKSLQKKKHPLTTCIIIKFPHKIIRRQFGCFL